jgi:hypothetical protein
MSDGHINRRRVLTFGATSAAFGVWSALGASAAHAQDVDDNLLVDFPVDIQDLPDTSNNIRAITIEELTIDAREMTGDGNVQVQMIRPGASTWAASQ